MECHAYKFCATTVWFARPNVRGEELLRSLCVPALPLATFLNAKFELIDRSSKTSRGEKWKAEFNSIAKDLGKDFRLYYTHRMHVF